jgi:hypothetical protein
MVEDTENYHAVTLGISNDGAYSYLSSGGFLDHIIISNELVSDYIPNSTAVYDPRNDIANYTTTTSDHGPVIARFALQNSVSTGDSDTTVSYATVYPNHTQDLVNITLKDRNETPLQFRLYNLNGKLMRPETTLTVTANVATVSIANVSSGMYLYTLTSANKVVQSGKIIKK